MPGDIGWSEAIDLVRILRSDPSSQLTVSIEGWSQPMSREALVLADLIDVQGFSKSKKWKPYTRPWDVKPKRIGKTDGRSRSEILAILGRSE